MRSWFSELWKKMKKMKGCEHDYVVVYQDNAVSLERCTKCGDRLKYGG